MLKEPLLLLAISVIGLQFHPETAPWKACATVDISRDELQPSEYIQPEETILSHSPDGYIKINLLIAQILTSLARKATSNHAAVATPLILLAGGLIMTEEHL